jgi:hypothetical protein
VFLDEISGLTILGVKNIPAVLLTTSLNKRKRGTFHSWLQTTFLALNSEHRSRRMKLWTHLLAVCLASVMFSSAITEASKGKGPSAMNHELHVAVITDDIDSVGHLLRGGVDPNIPNKVSESHVVHRTGKSIK